MAAVLAGCRSVFAAEPTTFTGHGGAVFCVRFSPDAAVLASASADNFVRFWQLSAAAREGELKRRERLVSDLDHDRFDVRENASRELARLGRRVEPMLTRAIAKPASVEVRARLRRLLLGMRTPDYQQHQAEVRCLAFSPDGISMASGSRDKTFKLWHAARGAVTATVDGESGTIWSVAFSPDGRILATGGLDHSVRLWETASRRPAAMLKGHGGPIHGLAFAPDGQTLASVGSFDRTVRVWDMTGGRRHTVLKGHTDAVVCVAFSPDGNTLASAGYSGTVRLWKLTSETVTRLDSFTAHKTTIRSVAFSPDGRTLATAAEDGTVRLWKLDDRSLTRTIEAHTGAVNSVTFSPNGRTIATGGADGTVKLWNDE